MPSGNAFYVTTPIYYVNDAPHVGHAYTTVAADAIARFQRLAGREVHFLTGLDEHGQKVLRAAQARGVDPQRHVDELARPFQDLWKRLRISNDDFIRTTEPRHEAVVQRVLQELHDRGEIYRQSYAGWYSTAEERFWTEGELVDGKCPLSGQPVEWIEESNWFFRMGRYQDRLVAWIQDHPAFLRPESRRNEVLGYLRQDLGDLCISRPKARLPWGIPLPFAPEWVTYVWFDALLNYVSAIGYGTDPERFRRFWPASFHLVGKDILTTHSVYWSTMLFAMGLDPAECLFAHGWWTIEGRKMSKTLRNVVDPNLLVDAYGPDAVRYFLLREVAFGADGDFSHRAFQIRYNADLANDFGNLAHRALSMTGRWLGGTVPPRPEITATDRDLEHLAVEAVAGTRAAMEALRFQDALTATWTLVQAGNKYIDTEQPWTLQKQGRTDRLATVMRNVLEVCRIAAVLVWPVCPDKAEALLAKIGTRLPHGLDRLAGFDTLAEGTPVAAGEPLFPRMTELPPAIQAVLAPPVQEVPPVTPEPPATPGPAPAPAPAPTPEPEHVSHDDVARHRQVVGTVLAAARHPKADRLLVLTIDLGEAAPRTVVAGIADRYRPEELTGRQVVVVANLKPVTLRGVRSDGMILAAGGASVQGLVGVQASVPPGTVVR